VYSDHLDLICAKNQKAEVLVKEIFKFLNYEYVQWDILYFVSLAVEGSLARWIQANKNYWRVRHDNKILAPYIRLDGGVVNFLHQMKRKKRYNLKREKKILFEKENANLKKIKDRNELDNALDNLFELHKARAREKGIKSTFLAGKVLNFHKDISYIFLEMGMLRFYLLKSNNSPIAAAYCFVFEGKLYFFQTGMDPNRARFSPGKVMIFTILENLENENIKEFDFLEGDEQYKRYWAKNYRELVTCLIFNKKMIAYMELCALLLKDLAKYVLIKIKIYEFLKSIMQGKLLYNKVS
jgi:CelD/BcsL family acetyltransferase involved in cellulose biosynthesis